MSKTALVLTKRGEIPVFCLIAPGIPKIADKNQTRYPEGREPALGQKPKVVEGTWLRQSWIQ
jgi:hypothetical protein